ncbi:MAG: hypothetical protein EZS28_011624 [Streblomastix strix]|uniref:Uncharacterized protein n=1 Tax=Streblomastix strix TaxID=222440 RepID=A0A5J4WD98_9EUKA|nr:MAG: hypothetical protein EZS28_011624 [Streblomastix strix]
MRQSNQKYYGKTADGPERSEHLKFWLGFSTACGPFNQFAILRDAQNLQNTAIYERELAVICSNSLTDLCINNSVSVSPLESIITGKRHCGIFLDVPLSEIDKAAWCFRFELVEPNFQLIPCTDKKLCIIILIAMGVGLPLGFKNQKPDIVYLLNENEEAPLSYEYGFQAVSGSMQSIMSFANIKALFMTFAMPQYPTCAPSDLYYSHIFENVNVDDKNNIYGYVDARGDVSTIANIFYNKTLFNGIKATKTLYPNMYMLALKIATDDSFMRGYNSSKIDPHQVALTPIMHYLYDAFIRITFDDNPDPQVLSIDVIGEIGGSSIRSG